MTSIVHEAVGGLEIAHVGRRYLVVVHNLDSKNRLEHVQLHSLVEHALWHLVHSVEEGSVHDIKHQVHLAICSKTVQNEDQAHVVVGL